MKFRAGVDKEVRALWGGGKGIPLTTVGIGWGLLVGARMIYPVIIPYLRSTYGLSLTAAGLLVSVLWVFYALGQYPAGILADRYDERVLMATSAITAGIALGLVIAASTSLALFVATAGMGLASSLYPIARLTFLSGLYSNRFGSALGVTMATADLGQTVLPPVASVLAVAIAWQAGLGFVVPLLLIIGMSIFVLLPKQHGANLSSNDSSLREMLNVPIDLHNPAVQYGTVVFFLYMFVWQSFTSFYPTYLLSNKGVSSSVASVLFGFFFAVGIVVKPLAGALYDRIGIQTSLVGILIPPVVGFALLPTIDSLWLLIVCTALISTMLGSGTITQSYLTDSFPEESQGTGLGMIKSATSILGAGGPVLFGLLADYNFFDVGYLVLAGMLAVTVFLTFRIPQS